MAAMTEPMTFVVERTSQWPPGGDTPPCPGAYRGRRTFDAEWAIRKGEQDVWLLDVPDIPALLRLVDENGRIIIDRHEDNESLWVIEFYDEYRE